MNNPRRKALLCMSGAVAAGLIVLAASPASAKPGLGSLYEGSPHNTFNGVWCVQVAVNVKADGIFGPATKQGVENFQIKRHLGVDGIVGPVTGQDIVSVDVSKGHANCWNWVPTQN